MEGVLQTSSKPPLLAEREGGKITVVPLAEDGPWAWPGTSLFLFFWGGVPAAWGASRSQQGPTGANRGSKGTKNEKIKNFVKTSFWGFWGLNWGSRPPKPSIDRQSSKFYIQFGACRLCGNPFDL